MAGTPTPTPPHYVASEERRAAILHNFERVTNGMTPVEVETVLGEPDVVRDLYEPKIKNPEKIGHTYWYYLVQQRPDKSHPGDKLVRVSLDLAERVTHIDHWGFE